MDHLILLVDRTSSTHRPPHSGAPPPPHHSLVIVEEKRAGLVLPAEWDAGTIVYVPRRGKNGNAIRRQNPELLLPQLLSYFHATKCDQAILTDYNASVAINVDHRDLEAKVRRNPCKFGTRQCGYEYKSLPLPPPRDHEATHYLDSKSPFDLGLKHSLAFMLYKALRELNVMPWPTKSPRGLFFPDEPHPHSSVYSPTGSTPVPHNVTQHKVNH
ncbi:hypothetical protein BCR35DRAFT_308911 [Leucosporidium creatinivorum]|uniref:Uncharacterized protein n=1 Tax=Leucosporidium creatinivorum TaxID=106004 RepID=A0A1Y2DUB3_9BASI|nr:hypothetical protein BCR35DRAFT_308911 [Leucosporidium creatinivorum]